MELQMQTDLLSGQPGRLAHDPGPSRHATFRPTTIGTHRPPFDGITISLHWITAFLVLAVLATAWLHAVAEEQKSDLTPVLLQIHRSIGVVVWAATALRLAWRLTFARLPPFPTQMIATHRAAVKLSEYGLYALLLVQPATGLLMTLFGGRSFALLAWQIPPLLPRDEAVRAAFHSIHELGAWSLAIVVAGHAGVALFHHFVLRDDVLACMTPGVTAPGARKEA
jgi:superoxide oxidase